MTKDLQFTFRRPCLEVSGEIGSLAELIGYMQEESTTLTMAFGDDMELVVQRISGAGGEPSEVPSAEPAKTRKPRAAKVEAIAPAPLPVPSEAPNALPTAPVDLTIPADGSVPAFLARPVAPPPPIVAAPPIAPLAPLPPAPPSPPPVGVLGPKVVKALETHKEGKPDGGQALADWLAGAGLTIKGATYDEACRAVLMTSDEKLKGVAQAFGVSA